MNTSLRHKETMTCFLKLFPEEKTDVTDVKKECPKYHLPPPVPCPQNSSPDLVRRLGVQVLHPRVTRKCMHGLLQALPVLHESCQIFRSLRSKTRIPWESHEPKIWLSLTTLNNKNSRNSLLNVPDGFIVVWYVLEWYQYDFDLRNRVSRSLTKGFIVV